MLYRIHRMKDSARESFRWAAHTAGTAILKPKDYEPAGHVEAATPYAAWKLLAAEGNAVKPGDALEAIDEAGTPCELQIAKYIGFEPAQWFVPASKTEAEGVTISAEISAAP